MTKNYVLLTNKGKNYIKNLRLERGVSQNYLSALPE